MDDEMATDDETYMDAISSRTDLHRYGEISVLSENEQENQEIMEISRKINLGTSRDMQDSSENTRTHLSINFEMETNRSYSPIQHGIMNQPAQQKAILSAPLDLIGELAEMNKISDSTNTLADPKGANHDENIITVNVNTTVSPSDDEFEEENKQAVRVTKCVLGCVSCLTCCFKSVAKTAAK